MPSAIPAEAAGRLPKARMIDPRGHRFGAGVSALLLIGAFVTNSPWLVAVVLLSIGTSAAFGLRYSIYGAIWRRIVKVGPPRSGRAGARVSAALRAGPWFGRAHPVAHRVHPRPADAGLAVRARGRGAPVAARGDRLLPGLPPVLPALDGAGPRHPDLDPWRQLGQHADRGADLLQVGQAPGVVGLRALA